MTRREQWTAGWHTYARLPGLLNARLNAFKRLYVAPDFPAEAKQIAGMLIAHARRCSGCFSATRTALLRLGFDEPTLDGYCANPAVLPLKERDRLFVQYTLKIATGSADLTPNDLREMEASGFSKTEIQEMMGFAAFWVFVAPATYRLAEGYFRFQTAGPLRLRGMADPVEAHVLEEEGSVVSRLEASLRRGVSPFRGREAQLRALGECWERAVGGQGEAVCLTGEPGIGKSRLIYELRRSLGITSYAEGAALSHARNSAYFLFRQLLCHLAVLDPEADLSAARQHLHRRLWDLSPELAPLVSDILPVFGTTCESLAEGKTDEREDRRDRFQEAVTAWVRAECRREPRLLVLEDLHWLDPSSEELLCHLAAEAHDLPLLLLTTSRFPITGGNLELAKIREILVPALPVEDIHALVDAQVEPYPANPRLRQVVVERAEGNPFFVEELVRAFRERGDLVLKHGVQDLKPGVDRVIPATINALLASRIDRLPDMARELLADAATLGKEFPIAYLRAMSASERFDDDLGLVQRRGFVDQRIEGPVATVAFRHVLTQEVAYSGMLQPSRQARHRRAAEMLERLYRGRTQEVCDQLGHHWAHSDQRVRALPHLLMAADGAAAVGANQVAITHLEIALGLMKEHPDVAPQAQHDAARLKLAGLYFVVGER